MNTFKKILVSIGVVLLVLTVFKLTQVYYKNLLDEEAQKVRVERIKTSKLEKVAEGQYQKLIADTLTIKQLKEKVDSLKIESDNPRIVEKLVLDFPKVDKPVDKVIKTDSIITVEDSYPNKKSPFVKYNFSLNLSTRESSGKFTLSKIPINIVVSEKIGNVHKADIIAPDFIVIDDFTFQSLPMKREEPDNFGWLAGAGMFNNAVEQRSGLRLTGGIRYKKIYLLGSVQTNLTAGVTALIEF